MKIFRFKKIWENKFFRAAFQIAFSFALIFGFIISLRIALGVENPIFVVSSGSMFPTLNIGDIVVIQNVPPAQLNIGDIVVFRNPLEPYGKPIVHRIVDIMVDESGNYKIVTAGDATGTRDGFSPWDASLLVGKVIIRIPYIGNLHLFLSSIFGENNLTTITIIIIIVLVIFVLLIEDENEEKMRKKELHIVYIISLNIVVIFLLLFSLWGHIRVWQPGASPPQWVSIFGMFEDLQVNIMRYGNENVSLVVGFMTYKIDCRVGGNLRQGVLTFSWFQFLLLILLLLDIMKILVPVLHSRKNRQASLYTGG